MNEAGLIYYKLDGASIEETERCRIIIHNLFTSGVLNIKNGSATLHFDSEGLLQEIRLEKILYKRKKP